MLNLYFLFLWFNWFWLLDLYFSFLLDLLAFLNRFSRWPNYFKLFNWSLIYLSRLYLFCFVLFLLFIFIFFALWRWCFILSYFLFLAIVVARIAFVSRSVRNFLDKFLVTAFSHSSWTVDWVWTINERRPVNLCYHSLWHSFDSRRLVKIIIHAIFWRRCLRSQSWLVFKWRFYWAPCSSIRLRLIRCLTHKFIKYGSRVFVLCDLVIINRLVRWLKRSENLMSWILMFL